MKCEMGATLEATIAQRESRFIIIRASEVEACAWREGVKRERIDIIDLFTSLLTLHVPFPVRVSSLIIDIILRPHTLHARV